MTRSQQEAVLQQKESSDITSVSNNIPAFVAGKNKIINGDFGVNQRGFSSTTANNQYLFDRWHNIANGTQTFTAQTFTAGSAPVAGYESTNYLQVATTTGSGTYAQVEQRIEDVRTFAGQTATFSFWARATSGTPKLGISYIQSFGSGGSSAVYSSTTAKTLSTTWTRYTVVYSFPSISGATIGSSSFLDLVFTFCNDYDSAVGQQAATIQIWGVQLESGSVATPFTTATGTVQGELAACQRYYYRQNTTNQNLGWTLASGSNFNRWQIPLVTTMRTIPSLSYSGTISLYNNNTSAANISSIGGQYSSTSMVSVDGSLNQNVGQSGWIYLVYPSTSGSYVEISAEL